jgi:hypothetical protein
LTPFYFTKFIVKSEQLFMNQNTRYKKKGKIIRESHSSDSSSDEEENEETTAINRKSNNKYMACSGNFSTRHGNTRTKNNDNS